MVSEYETESLQGFYCTTIESKFNKLTNKKFGMRILN